ncbi:MAG: hypothetical protein ACPL7M_13600, partial [Bryobacteraceae bacterium]
MPQPWDEPSEPFEAAEEGLPLAGLLAELLAGADAVDQPQASASTADPQDLPETPVSVWADARPEPLEAPKLLRALGEAQAEEAGEDSCGTPSQLLARLLEGEDGGPGAERGKEDGEREAAAPFVTGEGVQDCVSPLCVVADAEQAAAADEGIPPSIGEAGANASELAVPPP